MDGERVVVVDLDGNGLVALDRQPARPVLRRPARERCHLHARSTDQAGPYSYQYQRTRLATRRRSHACTFSGPHEPETMSKTAAAPHARQADTFALRVRTSGARALSVVTFVLDVEPVAGERLAVRVAGALAHRILATAHHRAVRVRVVRVRVMPVRVVTVMTVRSMPPPPELLEPCRIRLLGHRVIQ